MRNLGNSGRNRLMILICVVLCVVLGAFTVWARYDENRTVEEMREEVEAADEHESLTQEIAGWTEAPEEEAPEETEAQTETETTEEPETEPVTEAPAEAAVQGISFRGDSFIDDEEKEENGYPAIFARLLDDSGYDIEVQDYTMNEAGSMSQMKLAGVDEAILEDYIAQHEENAGGESLRITEVKLRDLTDEQMVRSDEDCIPVICMGYYGGWGDDLDELCEQIHGVLDTFHQQEEYLIVGIYPTGWSDKESYDEKMTEEWGDHYLQAEGKLKNAAFSDAGKQEIAELIYSKMEEMQYLP